MNNSPRSTATTAVTIGTVLVLIVLLGVIFLTDAPWWIPLLVALVVLLPAQMWLNRQRERR